jgi:hypothetical protein
MNITETKVCSICGEEKRLSEYYSQKRKKKDGTESIYYNPECKVCTKERSMKWKEENHDKVLISTNKTNNKPSQKEYQKIYKTINKEKYKNNLKKWQQKNKDKVKEYNRIRNNKKHKISNNEWEACKNYFNYRCAYCGLAIEDNYIKYKGVVKLGDFSKEHVIDDGANDLSNCVPACKSCNSAKREYTIEEWYNEDNEHFTYERLQKINNWLNEDYKKYIKDNKVKFHKKINLYKCN